MDLLILVEPAVAVHLCVPEPLLRVSPQAQECFACLEALAASESALFLLERVLA